MLITLLIRALVLLLLPTTAFAKRGGGGSGGGSSGDSDDDWDDDSGSSDTGTSDGNSCGTQTGALETYDIQPEYQTNSNATDSGTFFQGEAFFNYKIPKRLSGYTRNTDSLCASEWKTLRMLGYAWVGPHAEYPKGAKNPFIIGFKAWESENPVANISTSYWRLSTEYCPTDPDLVKFLTTEGVDMKRVRLENTDEPNTVTYSNFSLRVEDLFSLDVSKNTTDPEAVDIHGEWLDTEEEDDMFESPNILRISDGQGSEQMWIDIGWSEDITLDATITNTTLSIRIAGNNTITVDGEYYADDDVKCDTAVNITFSGTVDRVNSTDSTSIRQDNEPLVSFVKNDASGVKVTHLNYAIGMVWIICVALLYG